MWAGLNTTLVMFLSGLFSPTQHICLLFSFPHCPLCLPHPLCLLVLKVCQSWPFLSPPSVLPSLPYHCSSLQLLSPELPHVLLHPGIFIQLLKPSTFPLCSSLSSGSLLFFFPLQCPYKGRGALSEQEGVSLPMVLVWQGPLRWGISRRSREPSHARCLWALLSCHMCCTGRQSSDQHSQQGEYLENARMNWMYKKAQYFEDARLECISLGIPKGIHFKSSLQSMEALQVIKKTAGKIYFRWIKQCVFS